MGRERDGGRGKLMTEMMMFEATMMMTITTTIESVKEKRGEKEDFRRKKVCLGVEKHFGDSVQKVKTRGDTIPTASADRRKRVVFRLVAIPGSVKESRRG